MVGHALPSLLADQRRGVARCCWRVSLLIESTNPTTVFHAATLTVMPTAVEDACDVFARVALRDDTANRPCCRGDPPPRSCVSLLWTPLPSSWLCSPPHHIPLLCDRVLLSVVLLAFVLRSRTAACCER